MILSYGLNKGCNMTTYKQWLMFIGILCAYVLMAWLDS